MKKRSILISMLVIGVVAALIAAATTATFSDQVNSTGNTFTAGTLYMSVDGKCDRTATSTGGNWVGAAGNWGTDATAITTGSSGGPDANADAPCNTGALTFTNDNAGGGPAARTCGNMAPGDTCDTGTGAVVTNKGSLNGSLTITPTFLSLPAGCDATNWTIKIGGTTVASGTASAAISLTAGSSTTAAATKVSVMLNAAAGNKCQGVGIANNFTLVYHLVQA